MNYIEKIRADIRAYFDPGRLAKDSLEIFISPGKNFRLETANYWQSKEGVNWDVTKVEIFDERSNEKLFDFISNDGTFFHAWLETNNTEYLVCAEDQFGGQTVIDLTNKQMSSYSPNEDGFIWTDFHLSPDAKILATMGCYWACPSEIKLFDFTNPLTLPLKEINEIELLDNDEIILGWIDNETFKTKGIKRERILEDPDDTGSFHMKTISETAVERIININGTVFKTVVLP